MNVDGYICFKNENVGVQSLQNKKISSLHHEDFVVCSFVGWINVV